MELLVVIAIIAVLAAILLPALSRAKDQARSARCKSNLHQMGVALHMYVMDYKSYPYYFGDNGTWAANQTGLPWMEALEPYYPLMWTNRAYHCPGYSGQIELSLSFGTVSGSYSYNGWGTAAFDYRRPSPRLGLGEYSSPPVDFPFALRESDALFPSDLFAIGESKVYLMGGIAGLVPNDWLMCGLTNFGSDGVLSYPPRHGKNYNVVFCDAHVAGMPPSTIFDPSKTGAMWNNDHEPHPETWRPY